MLGANEPMTLGSPASPSSPGTQGQNQFLPSYLMGDPSAAVSSVSVQCTVRSWDVVRRINCILLVHMPISLHIRFAFRCY